VPTRKHEVCLELIRKRPTLAPELLEFVRPGNVPSFGEARLEPAELNDHQPTEYRVDAVVTLRSGRHPRLSVIVEIQRGRDTEKRWTWPVYLATQRARARCPVMLLVICPDRGNAVWCRKPIEFGHPGLVLRP
jgi:hypothetical protein